MVVKFYKVSLVMFFLVFIVHDAHSNMTEKQMKTATKLMRNACQPKNKISDEEINDLHIGKWSDAPNVKCYMFCILVNMKVLKKNGQPDWKLVYDQVNNIPEARIAPTIKSMDKCKVEVEMLKDKCDNAWRLAKCIYDDNPENYFFP